MKTLFIILTLSLTAPAFAQNEEHRAWIATNRSEDVLAVQGKFANDGKQAVTLRYELVTIKQGASGNSRSAQSGEFTALPGEEVPLSRTSVNVTNGDTYVIELKILRDGIVYLEDRLEY